MKRLLILFALSLLVVPARADVFRPAYLQLKQTGAETYDILWKVPALDAQTTLKVAPVFPEGTLKIGDRSSLYVSGTAAQRWKIRVPGGLAGRPIAFSSLAETGLDVLVRVERADGSEQIGRILALEPNFILESEPDALEVVGTYTKMGVIHILTGWDHLLFVLALILITRGGWLLVKTVTAFTVSHSLTLAAAALGWIHVPGPPVEAIIALSIVFVASECVHGYQGRAGITARAPWLVAFVFGLLHGLGFASVLGEVGLPQGHIPLALLFFSTGVEIGHFLFVGAVLGIVALAGRIEVPFPAWTKWVPPYAIGTVAMFWLIERMFAF